MYIKRDVPKIHFSSSALSLRSVCTLPRSDSLIFMNSRTTEVSVFSCKSGNRNNPFFIWILFCLLPKFQGTPFAFVSFLLVKAIDRSPSGALAFETFG
ncbi:hypothetical protein L3X38_035184 [Prunus dulcis]|uniref:Uncharacterized protein n=1 Tax=Prunus dulcis TaxID=3755 RepID=A0AAD4YYK4_PRUDU|nr:hypothetical protein L3X38_035184 [Prunus dulcis]